MFGATSIASVLRLFLIASVENSADSSFGLSSAPSSWRADLAIQPVDWTCSLKRSAVASQVPTMAESGYPGYEAILWFGLFAPKGTPGSIVTKLREAIKTAAHSAEFLATLDKLGQELAYMDQPEFASFWAADAKKMEDAIDSIGRVQG